MQVQGQVQVQVWVQQVQTHEAHCPFSVVVVVQAHEIQVGAVQPLPIEVQSVLGAALGCHCVRISG